MMSSTLPHCKSLPKLGVLLFLSLFGALPNAHADRIWWDGSRDKENGPPGKLLSDNGGYWGDRITTGVEYSYLNPPDNPGDSNRRLLDGVPQGDWNAPVGLAGKPIVVTFDFKRICKFSEVDISTRSQKAAFKIESASDGNGPWESLLDQSKDQTEDKMFHRLQLPGKPSGRYLRLTVNAVDAAANGITYLEEVVVWGDAADLKTAPEVIAPVASTPVITGVALPSIPGATGTTFSDAAFGKWQWELGDKAKLPAVWSQVSTWNSITNQPLLPSAKSVGLPVQISMARNETENAALTLTNTDMVNLAEGEVALSDFHLVGSKAPVAKLKGSLRVAGAISSRFYGTVIGPLFESDNMPSSSLMRRYLTNSPSIEGFPRLTLTPAGSIVLWLSVTSNGVTPGIYEAELSFKRAGQGAKPVVMAVRVRVVDVTLPDPFIYLNTWDHPTGMFPFTYADRQAREVAHKQSIGMSIWHHFPTPGSDADLARRNDIARGRAHKQMYHVSVLPYSIINESYNNRLKPGNLTESDKATIAEYVRSVVKQAKDLRLGYDDWYGELWDEPGQGNAELFGVLARLIKATDPKINLYMNPIFWGGSAPAPDEVIAKYLSPYYRSLVNVSVPIDILMRGYPQSERLFDAPRLVNATYRVSTHGDKDERAPLNYQTYAWDTFARGYTGWGFYAYYRPIGDPWNDFDGDYPDYIMVYPGPRGPIPSRTSESVREGWEDYRLLTLLKQQGHISELASLLKQYDNGESPEKLRLRALAIAAAKPVAKPKAGGKPMSAH